METFKRYLKIRYSILVSHLSLFSYSEEGQNGRMEIAKKSLWGKVSKIPNPRMPAKASRRRDVLG